MYCRICMVKKLIDCRFCGKRAYLCTCCGSVFRLDYNTGTLKCVYRCCINLKNKT